MAKKDDDFVVARMLVDAAPLGAMVKQVAALAHSKPDAKEAKQRPQECYESLLRALDTFECDVIKTHSMTSYTAANELKRSQVLQQDIESKMGSVQSELVVLKTQLAAEKVERAHREEYDSLAKIIHQFAPRHETLKQISSLQAEVNALMREQNATARDASLKRKQFSLFLHALNDLKQNWNAVIASTVTDNSQTDAAGPPPSPLPSPSSASASATGIPRTPSSTTTAVATGPGTTPKTPASVAVGSSPVPVIGANRPTSSPPTPSAPMAD